MAIEHSDKIIITGGTGFLGSFVIEQLTALGYTNLLPLRKKDFDLTHEAEVDRLYQSLKPTVVIHLAAEVGGIGANRDNPGRFFFPNLPTGLPLIEGARKFGLKKFVQAGTICAYPKFAPVPFRESELWNGFPEETNAPYGIAKKSLLVMAQSSPKQSGLNPSYLLPETLSAPGDNSPRIPAM